MSIIKTEAYFTSANGFTPVYTKIWADDSSSPKAVVQILHGLAEHIGRYDGFASYLAGQGFIVCGSDHLGHGKTAASIADLGFVAEGDYANMVRDADTLSNIMKKRHSGLPYFVIGHSLGSLLARILVSVNPGKFDGAVFIGTLQLPAAVTAFSDPVSALTDKLPAANSSGNVFNDIYCKITKKILGDDDDLAWLSASVQNRENYRLDPYSGFSLTNSLVTESITAAVKACLPTRAAMFDPSMPMLILSGGKDPVGAFGRGVLAFSDSLVECGCEPDVILYPGMRHEILNEEENEKVYADILSFLNAHLTDET